MIGSALNAVLSTLYLGQTLQGIKDNRKAKRNAKIQSD